MSSIYGDNEISSLIENESAEEVVSALEKKIGAGAASEDEKILCGIMLMMPPFADYEASAEIFGAMMKGRRAVDAAIWDAYRFSVLLPVGDEGFEPILQKRRDSAVAAHMRSTVAAARGQMDLSIAENRLSRSLRIFPFNAIDGINRDVNLSISQKKYLWIAACDLVISRSVEKDARPKTVVGAIQRYWDNLIIGNRLTNILWDRYVGIYGAL
ncbi:hypothetical protein [Nitrospirillum viridazoti]|uniref:hypothetical protein n=1 Tax=Nitrospirillum viridazoti TaxID=3144925 RepID=UPI0011A3C51E|nr:hypothetical protein [Nitrospirillum amazonense]TWB35399.1 hypothetical protein FBZ91_110121 [Nitrospirillum amazonense]